VKRGGEKPKRYGTGIGLLVSPALNNMLASSYIQYYICPKVKLGDPKCVPKQHIQNVFRKNCG
jgi:hypothetical protein